MGFLLRIVQSGIKPDSDGFERKTIVLLNIFTILACVAICSAFINSLMIREPAEYRKIYTAFFILLLIVPFLLRRSVHLAAIYIMAIANGLLLFFSVDQGSEAGAYLYFFPVFLTNVWLIDFRKKLYSLTLVAISVICITCSATIDGPVLGLTFSEEVIAFSFRFNLICSSLVMAANTLGIAWVSYLRQNELEEKIIEEKQSQHSLGTALKQKEILVAEIHHRVKNNLAVIRSLLNLQMNTTNDPAARAALRESVNRVGSMALIHKKLYGSIATEKADMESYAKELAEEIVSSYLVEHDRIPEIDIRCDLIQIGLNQAVPCGLILNELLTNIFKHAFPDDRKGRIQIRINYVTIDSRKHLQLIAQDDGIGFVIPSADISSNTLGLTIISSLTDQLDGKFRYESKPGQGTVAILTFPV